MRCLILLSETFVLAVTLALTPLNAQQPPSTPSALKVADNQALLLTAHGQGAQIYTCKSGNNGPAWTLKAPDAQLLDGNGKVIGKHFAGPTWQATDGSSIKGKLVASSPSPQADSIPWLLLSVAAHDGNGILTKVANVQRLNTVGGKAPEEGCDASHIGAEKSVQYSADYYFYSAPGQ
jgi:hypothetical protein